ncbi:type IV secretion system protein [Pseudomonas fluorescens]|uniref:type IV secretion system protein n=2 Tax=Pseudomonas fluorescens TaxID=294 RepID=UPI00372D170C
MKMTIKRLTIAIGLATAIASGAAMADVVPVIDALAIEKAIANGVIMSNQLTQIENNLNVARNQYSSLTGSRGLGTLLSDSPRNGLPDNWAEGMALLNSNSGPTYGDLANSATQIRESQAVLSSSEAASLSPQMQSYLSQMRNMSANQQALGQAAYTNSATRIATLQRLTNSINAQTDPKAIMDLQAVAQSEQAKLANDQAQLQSVQQLTQANDQAARQMQNELRMQVSGSADFPAIDTSIPSN